MLDSCGTPCTSWPGLLGRAAGAAGGGGWGWGALPSIEVH